MKPSSLLSLFVAAAVISLAASLHALEPPRIILHSATVAKPMDDVFGTLKTYFSDAGLSKFDLVSADQVTGAIVAKQTGIDSQRWREWTACEVDPLHMLYRFNDGTVTVTVKVQQAGPTTSRVTVSSDFQGTYVFGQDQNTVACRSTGTLEDSVLTVAGATLSAAGH